MSPELDESLCRKYPLLYGDRNAPMSTTCMCWGFPDDGWYDIINRLSRKLERAIEALPTEEREHCRAAQVKEKFGTLRFYMTASTDEMEEWIEEAEKESARTCETCGAPGKLTGKGWLKTACEEHAK
jgi:hypothetical protein